jgi:hypothetical protein
MCTTSRTSHTNTHKYINVTGQAHYAFAASACADAAAPFGSLTALIRLPTPTAMEPIACAVPLARKAPPAPAAMPGRAGIVPIVMSTAEMAVIAFGCSVERKESAWEACTSHVGAWATVSVTRMGSTLTG